MVLNIEVEMKIALCFYGLVGSRADKNGNGISLDPSLAYKLNYENIIKDNDVDVFIHSWSKDFENELVSYITRHCIVLKSNVIFLNRQKLLIIVM